MWEWRWWYLALWAYILAAGAVAGLLILKRQGRLGKFTWHLP